MSNPIDYLNPAVPGQLPWYDVPLIRADAQSLSGYGYLVDTPESTDIEIVPWPAQGFRAVDAGTGNEGGIVEGTLHSEWVGAVLKARNDAVNGDYVLGWSCNPADARADVETDITRVLLWHLNYHPDGGQLFFPLEKLPFVVPLALPGDDLSPDRVVAFYCDGNQGLYIHPNIWHEGVFPTSRRQSFLSRQGRVHARVSCDLTQEFGVFLQIPMQADAIKTSTVIESVSRD